MSIRRSLPVLALVAAAFASVTLAAPASAAVATGPALDAASSASSPASSYGNDHAPTTIALPDGIQPEGITSSGSTYYVGSLNDGRIVTGSLVRGGESKVLLTGATGRQLRGLEYDFRTGLVWAVGNVGTVAHVWAVDSRSGRIASDTVVAGGGFLNDLIITPTAVWVTDSRVERLTRIPLTLFGKPTGKAPTFLTLGGAWPGTQAGGLSANGIRQLDRTHVVLDHSTAGGLWSVDLRTGKAVQIPVTGGPAITGGDGLERRGSTLFVVRGTTQTSVAQLTLQHTRSGWTAKWQKLLTDPSLDVPSTATYSVGALFAVNARFGTASPATAKYYITRLR
ncbi:hypothetical protein ABIB25_004693 [Nakamurella sp. UYEF19]|uniref:hypothetical protein n=1 Tax=Nakamurella sp. UYEF19 TaxID=1756392 RepID=UPI003398F343